MRSTNRFLLRLSLLLYAGLYTPTVFACSFVNEQVASTNAEAVSWRYWIASILLGGVLIGSAFHQRRGWLFPVLALALLIFHPYWTLPPLHGPDCVFVNVRTSQIVLTVICLMLGYRIFTREFMRRHRVTVGVASGIGILAVGAVVILPGLQKHGPPSVHLLLTWMLPSLLPFLLLAGFVTGFIVAPLLGTASLLKRMVRLRTKG